MYLEDKRFPYIPKDELVEGADYFCIARNFEVGTWTGKGFEYTRYKFGDTFQDVEFHYDDGAPHGTVKPLLKLLKNTET